VGVSKDDLDKYNPNLIRNADRVFLFTKNKLYDNFFDVDKNMKLTYGKDTHINIQIFFALDNKRYLINNDDSFKNAANDFIEKIVKNYPLKEGYYVIKKVNNKLKKQLKKCKERIENPNIVPFAFSKKSRSRVSKKLLNR
jgi:ribosome-associated translation inhibitor RaiA